MRTNWPVRVVGARPATRCRPPPWRVREVGARRRRTAWASPAARCRRGAAGRCSPGRRRPPPAPRTGSCPRSDSSSPLAASTSAFPRAQVAVDRRRDGPGEAQLVGRALRHRDVLEAPAFTASITYGAACWRLELRLALGDRRRGRTRRRRLPSGPSRAAPGCRASRTALSDAVADGDAPDRAREAQLDEARRLQHRHARHAQLGEVHAQLRLVLLQERAHGGDRDLADRVLVLARTRRRPRRVLPTPVPGISGSLRMNEVRRPARAS